MPEYFLYDPTAESLNPALQGFRLEGESYCRIEPDASGALVGEQLDLLLRLEGRALALFDRASGERLLTESEAERQAREAERAEAAAEIERLRRLLEDARGE